jgi:hypothetical protein
MTSLPGRICTVPAKIEPLFRQPFMNAVQIRFRRERAADEAPIDRH